MGHPGKPVIFKRRKAFLIVTGPGATDGALKFYDGQEVIPLSVDPSAGGGVAAPLGSIGLRDDGTLWKKSGAGDTAWIDSGDHGSLSGLADDDHTQYHNDTRGDARYYTETELDAGQLDNRYYTETELDAGQLDNRYFTEAEHIAASAGVGDAGKPVVLDAAGNIDASMLNDGDIDHDSLTGVSADDHHAESHTIASHSDTTATGTELETLTDASNADALHAHAHSATTGQTANDHHAESHTIASHSDTTATGAELDTLTDGSNADALHVHAAAAAGASLINYCTNPDAETDTTGWAAYADAAGVSPVDGTGGAPTSTLTRNTTTPLRGTGDFKITKDAANRQGEGVSFDFSVDDADKGRPIAISFDYKVTTNYVDGDAEVFLYDVTNAAIIPMHVDSSLSKETDGYSYAGSFESVTTSASYRLIIHIAGTTATAWDMLFDNVKIGPSTQDRGSHNGYDSGDVSGALGASFASKKIVTLEITGPGPVMCGINGTPGALSSLRVNDPNDGTGGVAFKILRNGVDITQIQVIRRGDGAVTSLDHHFFFGCIHMDLDPPRGTVTYDFQAQYVNVGSSSGSLNGIEFYAVQLGGS